MAEKSHLATQIEKRVKDSSLELTTVLVARAEILQEHSLEAMHEWIQSLVEACSFIENDIKTLSAEQTAIIQEPYFGFERTLVSSSLTKRRGGIRFSFVIPEKNILQLYLKQAQDLKIVQKQVDIESLLFTHVFNWKKKEGSIQ
jgi:hypothetical protein